MSTANRSHETFVESAPFGGDDFRLDKSAGVVRGVAICGFKSKNGRDYPKEVLARDHKKYEGMSVNLNHYDGERQVSDYLGRLENVRIRPSDGKPIGDLKYVKNKPFTPEFEERVLEHPNSFGLSHVAVCATKRVGGREQIESLNHVVSVDLVRDPATNVGLFESTQTRTPMEETEKRLSEATAKVTEVTAEVTRLTEQVTTLTTENAKLKADADLMAVAALFTEAGIVPSDVQRKAVSAMPTPEERKALVESFKAAFEGQKVKSYSRDAVAGVDQKAVKESQQQADPHAWVELDS